MKGNIVGDVMHVGVISCTAGTSVREAINILDEHRIHALVVVDGPGYLAGIVSQTDVLRAWRRGGSYEEVMSQPVSNIMTRSVITCMPHIPLERAAKMLTDHHIHRLVVVEERNDGRLWPIGILSMTDIVRAISSAEVEEPEMSRARAQ